MFLKLAGRCDCLMELESLEGPQMSLLLPLNLIITGQGAEWACLVDAAF